MGNFQSTSATIVPSFMLCDGHFVLSENSVAPKLSSWCGWIRFEGHGAYVIRKVESSEVDLVGQWSIIDDSTVRLSKPAGAEARVLMIRDDLLMLTRCLCPSRTTIMGLLPYSGSCLRRKGMALWGTGNRQPYANKHARTPNK